MNSNLDRKKRVFPPKTPYPKTDGIANFFITEAVFEKSGFWGSKLKNPYQWHRIAWFAFPGTELMHRPFLFRIDETADNYRMLIQSSILPTIPDDWNAKSLKLSINFYHTNNLPFLITVNPTKKGRDGKRYPIKTIAGQKKWLKDKFEKVGCVVFEPKVLENEALRFRKKNQRGSMLRVQMKGVLQVREKDVFVRKGFFNGVGPGKSFGHGMIVFLPKK